MFIKNSKYEILTDDGFSDFDGIQIVERDRYVHLYFNDGSDIRTSFDHKFFNVNDEEIISTDLIIGDILKGVNIPLKIINIKKIYYINKKIKLYDPINVKKGYRYYSNGVLSHNCLFLGSSATVIDSDTLRNMQDVWIEPLLYDLQDKLRIYEKPIEGASYVIGCLTPEEKVLTNNGSKSVKNVLSTDMLYDENGNLTKINNIQLYKDVKERIFSIKPYGTRRFTTFTEEHPILISRQPKMKRIHGGDRYRDFKFEFTKTSEIKKDDWLKFPNIYKDKKLNFDINDKWSCYNDITRKDFLISSPLSDPDFWWFVGIWLGDGWLQQHNNHFTVHTCHNIKTEKHYAIKIQSLFEKYNRKVTIVDRGRSTIDTVFSSKQLYHFLINNFNKGALNKFIPEWVKMLPKKLKTQLVKGYIDSDGCLTNNKNFIIVSISLNLLEGIQDICYSLGVLSSIGKLRDRGLRKICGGNLSNCKETYCINFSTYDSNGLAKLINYDYNHTIHRKRNKRYQYFDENKNFIFIRIQEVIEDTYEGDVYNFETQTHTFLSRNITTHNCDVAKGTGRHYSTSQVLKIISTSPLKLEQVATYQNNFVDVYNFSSIINKLSYFYNNAYLMVENNADGAAVVTQLHWEYENENLVNSGGKMKDLGVRATKQTKPKAVLFTKRLIESGDLLIKDQKTIMELNDFIDKGNNKYGANNYDDDLVAALYWACYLFQMEIVDNVDFMKRNESEEDGWGILSDVNDNYEVDDFVIM